jgi:hypothetical protein
MRIERKQYEDAVAYERNRHHRLYEWLGAYVKKYKKLPKDTDFYLQMVSENFKNDPQHYEKLKG